MINPYLDIEEINGKRSGVLVATNAACMSIIPVEVTASDKTGHVSKVALQIEIERVGDLQGQIDFNAFDSKTLAGGSEITAYEISPFPNWRNEVEKATGTPPANTIRIDANLLAKCCRAIGTTMVEIDIRGQGDALVIRPASDTGSGYCLLMPIRSPEGGE